MHRIAIFGGTFNPIHNGHINLCLECAKNIHFDKILIIPTNIPPHKNPQSLAPNKHRLEMCRLATLDTPIFEVCDIEMKHSGVSYTVNTIKALEKRYENTEFYLIIGSDMLFTFHEWVQYECILNKVHLVAGARAPSEYAKMVAYAEKILKNTQNVNIIHTNVVQISSTELREKMTGSISVKDYIDPKVYRYIVNNKLYFCNKF